MSRKLIQFLLIILLGVTLAGCGKSNTTTPEPEPKPKLIPATDLPLVKIVPHSDHHRLDVSITDIKVKRMDYQVIYSINFKGNNIERGFGGRDIKLTSTELIKSGNNAVVFGSESSGKFKYDEGVETGTLEITYRDDKGKATGRAQTEWKISDSKTATEFTTLDKNFSFKPTGKVKGLFLTLNTLGLPKPIENGTVVAGPYGIFASDTPKVTGTITFNPPTNMPLKVLYFQDTTSTWKEIPSSQGNALTASAPATGIFVVISK